MSKRLSGGIKMGPEYSFVEMPSINVFPAPGYACLKPENSVTESSFRDGMYITPHAESSEDEITDYEYKGKQKPSSYFEKMNAVPVKMITRVRGTLSLLAKRFKKLFK